MAVVRLWRSAEITASWKHESDTEVEKEQLSRVIMEVWHRASLYLHYFKQALPPAVLIATNSYRCFVASRSIEIMAIICAIIVISFFLRLKWTPPKYSLMHFKLNVRNSAGVHLPWTLNLWWKKAWKTQNCSFISNYCSIQVINKWDWGQLMTHILMHFRLFILSFPFLHIFPLPSRQLKAQTNL